MAHVDGSGTNVKKQGPLVEPEALFCWLYQYQRNFALKVRG